MLGLLDEDKTCPLQMFRLVTNDLENYGEETIEEEIGTADDAACTNAGSN